MRVKTLGQCLSAKYMGNGFYLLLECLQFDVKCHVNLSLKFSVLFCVVTLAVCSVILRRCMGKLAGMILFLE